MKPAVSAAIALLGTVLVPAAATRAFAQVPQQAPVPASSGFTVTPSVALATVYDDNIFVTPSARESDTILRLSPALALDYVTARTTFHLDYGLDAEKYRQHSGLDSWDTRQGGLIDLGYEFSRRLRAGVTGTYAETHQPGELTPISGLVLTRTRATSASLRPSLTYRFDPRTSTTIFYAQAREEIAGGPRTDIGTASVAVDRELTERDALKFQFQDIAYDFADGPNPTSRVFTVGWSREVSPRTDLVLGAGPRDTEGRVVPEILASVAHRAATVNLTLSYRRSQVSIVGLTGVVDTQAIEAGIEFQPVRNLGLRFTPGIYRDTQGDLSADVYHLGFQVWYALARDWYLVGGYDYGRQSGTLGTATDQVIARNVVAVGIQWVLGGPGEHRAMRTALPVAAP